MALGSIVGNLFADMAPSLRKTLGGLATDSVDEGQLARYADPELIIGKKGMMDLTGLSGRGPGVPDEQIDIMQDNLATAKRMFDRGATNDEIIAKTGFYFDENKNLKMEIDDSQAKFLPDPEEVSTKDTYKLADVFDHPTFFQAYPDYKGMNVKFYNGKGDERGQFDAATSTIKINKNAPGFIDGNTDAIISTILHETQHAIQVLEKFTAGGGYKQFLAKPEDINDKKKFDEAFRKYLAIAGEAEARNVEYRFLNPSMALRSNFLQTLARDPLSASKNLTREQLTNDKGMAIDMRSQDIANPFYKDPMGDTTEGL